MKKNKKIRKKTKKFRKKKKFFIKKRKFFHQKGNFLTKRKLFKQKGNKKENYLKAKSHKNGQKSPKWSNTGIKYCPIIKSPKTG